MNNTPKHGGATEGLAIMWMIFLAPIALVLGLTIAGCQWVFYKLTN